MPDDIDWRSHYAFTLGIALSVLTKGGRDAVSNNDKTMIRTMLSSPGAKAIARQEPNRLLAAMMREYGINFEGETAQ